MHVPTFSTPVTIASLALVLLLFAPSPAGAQTECTTADPCAFVVEVGPTGFIDQNDWTRSMGDVVTLEIDNSDEVSHTVTLSGYGITLTVPAAESKPHTFTLTQKGTFTLTDSPSGDTGTLLVVEGDAVDYQSSTSGPAGTAANPGSGSTTGIPGLAVPLIALVVAIVAAMRRN